MMIKIDAIVREEKFEDVKQALQDIEVNGITVSQVMGCGAQRGYTEIVRGMEIGIQMRPKIKFEIVVSSDVSTVFSVCSGFVVSSALTSV